MFAAYRKKNREKKSLSSAKLPVDTIFKLKFYGSDSLYII